MKKELFVNIIDIGKNGLITLKVDPYEIPEKSISVLQKGAATLIQEVGD